MQLLRLISEKQELATGPILPKGGWNVGQLAHDGIILSCDGFILKLDADNSEKFYGLIENGEDGEIKDQFNKSVFVEIGEDEIVLTRSGDKAYPNGVILDRETLKKLGIEPDFDDEGSESGSKISEGVKRAYKRVGKKIKRGWRVTSGFRKGRVVSNPKTAFKPRAKAKTRMKLRVAAKRKKIVRLLKSRITRRKSVSKRLRMMNKRLSGRR